MGLDSLVSEILEYAEDWDNRYLDLNVRAIHKSLPREDAEELIEEFLSKKSQFSFNSANPFSKKLLLSELLPKLLISLAEGDVSPDGELKYSCALVTFLRDEWNFPEGAIRFDPAKAKKIVRNALAGFDFIGRFEAVTYQNEFIDIGGESKPRVCFHCHCIIWTASAYSKLERLRKSLRHRFGGGSRQGAHFKKVDTPRGLAKSFRYISKVPTLGKRLIKTADGAFRQKSRVINLRSYFAMFSEMRKSDMYTFWLSGGEGARMLREARLRLREKANRKRPFQGLRARSRSARRTPKYRQD